MQLQIYSFFTQTWANLFYLFYGSSYTESFCLWSRVLITGCSLLYCEWLEIAALKRACEFMHWVLTGKSEGLIGLRVLERTCSVRWSCGIVHSRILHCDESRDIEQVARNGNKSPVFAISSLSLNSTLLTLVYILHVYTCLSYMHDIVLMLALFKLKKHLSTSTFNQKKSTGEVQSPSLGIRFHFLVIICMLIFVSLSF